MRVLQLHRKPNAPAQEFADAISADAALAAKVLALVNSAAFKPAARVTKVTQAVSMIGLKNLLPLVFGYSLGGIFNKVSMPPAERTGFWRASLLKAVVARELTSVQAPEQAEEAFLTGLFQDVALPLLYATDKARWFELANILQIEDDSDRAEREQRINGIDHAELGAILIRELALPELYCLATRQHHAGVAALEQALANDALARALDTAAAMPHRLAQASAHAVPTLATKIRSSAGVADPNAAAAALKQITGTFGTLLGTFGDADETSVAFKDFMHALGQEVAAAMESAVGASTAAISELKARESDILRKMDQLQEHAARSDYDGLTGALTRRGFLARAERMLTLAREYQKPCAVGFLDMNDFKAINDGHGHAVGDAALMAVSGKLVELVRNRGIVGRLGGDEFAVLLLGADAAALRAEVERVRQGAARFTVAANGRPLNVTASLGVVMAGVPQETERIENLLRDADVAMYDVKRQAKGNAIGPDATVPPASGTTGSTAPPAARSA
jgi:diguanylate cyclase (GGDEF)-like protein